MNSEIKIQLTFHRFNISAFYPEKDSNYRIDVYNFKMERATFFQGLLFVSQQ